VGAFFGRSLFNFIPVSEGGKESLKKFLIFK